MGGCETQPNLSRFDCAQHSNGGMIMAGPLGTDTPTMKAPSQSSAKLNTSVGSGSRPGNVRFPIESSAPMDPYGLDGRMVPGYLGSGKEKGRGN